MGPGHLGPVCQQLAYMEANKQDTSVPTPPLRRSAFSSIRKGVTLEEWKNMGRTPGDGFSPSRGWLVSSLYVGRACALRLPTTSLPRVTGPTRDVSPEPPLRGHVTHR